MDLTPTPGDLPPPRLVSPRGALRRSLLVWGWGQLATGDRRGVLLAILEVGLVAALARVVAPYAKGTASGLVFLAGAAFLALWAGQAIHAERRAARRWAPYATHPPSGAVDLLWLAPILVGAATAFWSFSGPATAPDSLLAAYLDAWRTGRTADAARLFAANADPSALGAVWERQGARLDNAAIRAAAAAGPDGGIDPAQPWDAVRWEPPGTVGGASGAGGTGVTSASSAGPSGAASSAGPGSPAPSSESPTDPLGRPVVAATIVRRETVRDTFFGLVPTTTERLVPVADLGTVRLRTVELPGPFDGAPPVVEWRIDEVDLLGERIG